MALKRLSKPRFILVYPLVLGLFLVARTTEWSLGLGLVIILLGEALRLWANGYVGHVKVNWTQRSRGDAKIGHLITAGPYAHVRHPLYVGTFLIGAGFCAMVGNLWLILGALGFFFFVYRKKAAREEALIRHEWGEEYDRYARAVPRWFPTWRAYPGPSRQWSWQGITASRELKTLIWLIVLVILLYFREELIQEREQFWARHEAKHIFLLGLALALALTDGVSELVRRWRKIQTRRLQQS